MMHEFDHHKDNKALAEWSNREGISLQLAHNGMRIFHDLPIYSSCLPYYPLNSSSRRLEDIKDRIDKPKMLFYSWKILINCSF
ncbi:hypothetical protein IEQ34_000205 [Dendrobium chrysotoxum]|uniref:Uncharacterized protein n=1 Tax=Dendrobium chrysotoxum TaxID=161865 RepID=A0AAV7HPU9_DENCH|nr:hypothetical protein IEQ34_000205 [Dendrobium chrysotoxum]